jgi:small neutral amino acid transporter SnatA (MarC family)
MNTAVAIIALAAALNPARRGVELAKVERRSPVILGALLAFAGYLGAAAVASSLLDGLDISDPNAQIAAAFVVGIRALIDVFRTPKPEPLPSNIALAALWPVTFPALLRPELVVLAVAVGSALGIGPVAIGALIGLVATVALHQRIGESPQRWVSAITIVLTLTMAVDLLVDGILSV